MKKYQNFTNAELNLKMKSLENEYESTKHKILELIEKMEKLDSEYIEAQAEVENRNKGIWQ
mgnify:FL=1|jgi:hypothetical protein|nr:MAG TPA: Thermonuclease [Caudoviricetes sp.]